MTKRQEEVETIQEYNRILLSNLMPDHVVNHFLNPDVNALVSTASMKHEACMCTDMISWLYVVLQKYYHFL